MPSGSDFKFVRVADVSRHFGRRRALAHVNAEFHVGEVVGLLGPNGAGKSTLLGLLAMLLTPSLGEIRYGQTTPATAGPDLRRRLGLLAHDLYLYPELTAAENLEFFARLYDVPDASACVARALDRSGLTERAHEAVLGYSRGMRQRLALERTLLHGPRLVLLDEPFTGLDDASVRSLVSRLRELADAGAIVILATHDLDVVSELLDRAILISAGRVVADDRRPADLRGWYRHAVAGGPH